MVADHWPATVIIPGSLHLIAADFDRGFELDHLDFIKTIECETKVYKILYSLDTFLEQLW